MTFALLYTISNLVANRYIYLPFNLVSNVFKDVLTVRATFFQCH